MPVDPGCRALLEPVPSIILVVPNQFFLLGVNGYDRIVVVHLPLNTAIDELKLSVAVGVLIPFLGLPVALQAVPKAMERLCNRRVADIHPAMR